MSMQSGEQPDPFLEIISHFDEPLGTVMGMDGTEVIVDADIGEAARQKLLAVGTRTFEKMGVTDGQLTEKQSYHVDKVFRKLVTRGQSPFVPNELVAVGGTSVFLGYDRDEEVEIDTQIAVLTPVRMLFGRFAEVQYNSYPVYHNLADVPEDYEEDLVVEDDEEGLVLCLDDVLLCQTDEVGWKIDRFDMAQLPLAAADLIFYKAQLRYSRSLSR